MRVVVVIASGAGERSRFSIETLLWNLDSIWAFCKNIILYFGINRIIVPFLAAAPTARSGIKKPRIERGEETSDLDQGTITA
ncbi:hypothetical protein GCM10008997_08950 [Halomonas salifodinae]